MPRIAWAPRWRLAVRLVGIGLVSLLPTAASAAQPADDPRALLDAFMAARIERDAQRVLSFLTDDYRAGVRHPLIPFSNPCWYRYEVEAFDAQASHATARVRVYEHFWQGDVGGGPPSSAVQEIALARTGAGWRVAGVSDGGGRRAEAAEPHGPNTSACNVGRRAPVWSVPGRLPATGGALPRESLPLVAGGASAMVGCGALIRRRGWAQPAARARRTRHR